jgi:CCR4-NOT transcription complex subunit 1
VLKRLWDCNQPLMIRAICELCSNHQDQVASSNLNKVLDIT